MSSKIARDTRAARIFSESNFDAFAFGQSAASSFAVSSSFKATTAKLTDAFAIDGVGDLKPPLASGVLVVTPDEAGAGIGVAPGNPTLTVDAAHTIGTINTNGDEDFYQVSLVGGQTYQIGMYGYSGGPGGAPLADSYIEIRTDDGTTKGHLVVSGDGGANTPANEANSGFDVLLTFTPDTSGTYYIDARAFDNDPTDGTTGEGVGDYEVFVQSVDPNDPSVYHPYYDVDSPLYAIDWGTRVNKVNQSAANPDGDEGTRDTGNAQGTPVYSSSLDIPALAAAQGVDTTGKNVITVYFAHAGDVFVSNDPSNPGLPPATITAVGVQDFEHTAVITALAEFAHVADVVYLEVDNRDDADFVYTSYQGTPGPGVSLLGSMSPPDESDEGLAQFNSGDSRWNARDLAQGGFSFVTLIHEFGHGHGLAHPHDNGGHSGIMRGVEPDGPVADYTTGDYHLNQSVFTMMSYEDGWQDSPYGNAPTNVGYGYLGGLSPFDVAAIQDKYGVNEDWATGNDTYVMKDVNAAGTYYSSIWDGGGVDKIVYSGARDSNIDLREATLEYEYGGGGWVSYAYGIYGGYTIANGAVIENATSGSGNDTIHGNDAKNVLSSGGGADTIWMDGGGNDTAIAGTGTDTIFLGDDMTWADSVDGGAGTDNIKLQGNYISGHALTLGTGVVGVEQIVLLSGGDTRFGEDGTHRFSYDLTTRDGNVAAGQVMTIDGSYLNKTEHLTFNGAAETDGAFVVNGGKGTDNLTGGANNDSFQFRSTTSWGSGDKVDGGAGADQLGIRGNYAGTSAITMGADQIKNVETLVFMSGTDTLFGPNIGAVSYKVTMNNGNLANGQIMKVDASSLASGETLTFDGSGETDGAYRIFGGKGADSIIGSGGSDKMTGGLGGDTLTGGKGGDVFVLGSAADSTSTGYDTLKDLSTVDKIDLPTSVSGWATPVTHGALSTASFDSDLAGAIDSTLGSGQALLFTADSGDQSGKTFLVVDGNGDGSYTAGQDYVFALAPGYAVDTSSTGMFV